MEIMSAPKLVGNMKHSE